MTTVLVTGANSGRVERDGARVRVVPPRPCVCSRGSTVALGSLGCLGRAGQLLDAELCLSELAANAVRHAGTEFEVEVAEDDGLLRISVHDGSSRAVRPQRPDPAAVSGRGLQIVDSISHRWGVDPAPDGKTVWCTLEL